MCMEHYTEYSYRGLELLDTDIDILYQSGAEYVRLVCYHVNTEGKYPFMQFLLYNNYGMPFLGNYFQELDFPLVEITTNDIHTNVNNKIEYFLTNIYCDVTDTTNIKIKGHFKKNNQYYLFVDISNITITPLYLKKTTSTWFGLINEIINNRSVCDIPVSNNVYDLLVSDERFITLNDLENNTFRNADVVYVGSYFKQTEFQSIFGISKQNDNYQFLYSIQDAFKNGGWNSSGKSETKFNKNITDNAWGRYIAGGINRIALLSYLQKNVNNETFHFDDCDLINTNVNDKPTAIIKDVNQQVSLSYHRINKQSMGDKWDSNNCYCIE